MNPSREMEIKISIGHSGSEKIKKYSYQVLGREVSHVTQHFRRVIHYSPMNSQGIIEQVTAPQKITLGANEISQLADSDGASIIFLDGNFNHSSDIQGLLTHIKPHMNRSSRIVAVLYNPYLRILFRIMNGLGLRHGDLPITFVSRSSLAMLTRLAGFDICRIQPVLYCPFRLLGLGVLLNSLLRVVPLVKWLGFASVVSLRPIVKEEVQPSLSIIVPARNEAGNIPHLLSRLRNLETIPVEIIFVEGHSSDATWDAIQQTLRNYSGPFHLKAIRQSGKGKKNAVEEGFRRATGQLLTILDADMTMPPEKLLIFYQAYCAGQGDFINGSRLVYPMQAGAMQFLNHLGNIFFAKALSFVTDMTITDSLCGTKLLSREHYQAVRKWCADFGDFDPFGDFELIFPAAVLGLGVIDVPIRYEARTYGSTNISRFQHGFQLLRMTLIGFFTIKMGRSYQ